jgi:hypothetical protein
MNFRRPGTPHGLRRATATPVPLLSLPRKHGANRDDGGHDRRSPQPRRGSRVAASGGRRFPSVAGLTTISLAVVVVGEIPMASYVPGRPPLGLPTALACIGAALVLASVGLLSQLTDFAWGPVPWCSGGRCWPTSSRLR